MTIKELINELENFDENMEVVMGSTNSMYVNSIRCATTKELAAFFGKDREVILLKADNQIGAV